MIERQKLEDADEALLRHVHPTYVTEGRIGSQAFVPTKAHDFELSVSRSTLTTPAEAFKLHRDGKKLETAGVWAVTVGECQQRALPAFGDPVVAPVADAAHAIVDYKALSDGQRKNVGKLLRTRAQQRGRLFPAEARPKAVGPGSASTDSE